MDFDRDNDKWRCCCCRIPTGLKIMGLVEAIFAIGVMSIALHLLNQQAQIKTQHNEGNPFFAFYLCMAIIAFLIVATSLLMVLGVKRRKDKWLYPTLVARLLFVIFVTVFGVSIGVVQRGDDTGDVLIKPTKSPKRGARVKMSGKKKVNQEEPSTALRLVFLVFLMICVCIGVFYTVFLVVKGINYIQSYNRLKRRRSSFMVVAQLDPNLMAPKRPSQCSQNMLEQQQQQFLAERQQQGMMEQQCDQYH